MLTSTPADLASRARGPECLSLPLRRLVLCAITLTISVVLAGGAPALAKPPSPTGCQKAIHAAGLSLAKARGKKLTKCGSKAVKRGGGGAACLTSVATKIPRGKAKKIRKACTDEILQTVFPVCVSRGSGCGGSVGSADQIVSCLECNLTFQLDCLYALTFAPDATPPGCTGPAALRFAPE